MLTDSEEIQGPLAGFQTELLQEGFVFVKRAVASRNDYKSHRVPGGNAGALTGKTVTV